MASLVSSIRCHSALVAVMSSRARITGGAQRLIINHNRCHQRAYFKHHYNRHSQLSLRCYAAKSSGDATFEDDDWIPPDDSPLSRRNNYYNAADETLYSKSPAASAAEGEEVVEVIDLEATLNNKSNQYLLKNDDSSVYDASEFEVQSSNVEWDDILTELKESGEDEMLHRLVQEYRLHDRLKALEDPTSQRQKSQTNMTMQEQNIEDEEEDWLYEEESFEGLSDDDIIDELIENSPSLSQLELEILSQELKHSEEEDDGGMDFDSLENVNLNDNVQYQEFRAMVLEDYTQKKNKRMENKIAVVSELSALQEDEGRKSDFSDYPQNWTDYDSKQAFQRDFLQDTGDDAWIPPSTDFIPSSSYKEERPSDSNFDDTIDWLEARRSRLKQSDGSQSVDTTSSQLMTPDDAERYRHKKSQIEIIPFTLFTSSELSSSLSAQGGMDIRIIDVVDYDDLYGVGMGCSHLMVVTGRNSSHIRVMADSIVRNLKARKLNERGIVGATKGVEGGTDIFSNKRNRARASKNGITNTSARIDDDWMVVDCGNIHVHILEETTRKCINIESLWDLANPNSEGSKLRRVDGANDDDVDTYVAENPVPEEYSARMRNEASAGGWMTGDVGGRMILPGIYNRKSFSAKWSNKNKSKGRR
jgi:ribosomal silencing factor RsfS